MKKKFAVIVIVIFVYLCTASFTYSEKPKADNSDAEKELGQSVEEIIDNLDLGELQTYLSTLSDEQTAVIGWGGIKERIKSAISGNMGNDYKSLFAYVADIVGVNIFSYLPLIVIIIMVATAYNLLGSLRGRFESDSVQNIVYFSCVALLTAVLFAYIFAVINGARKTIESLQTQMDILLPILLTLMTAVGAGSSVSVYKPGVAILSGGIAEIITALILPLFIISTVLISIGNLHVGVKLGKLSEFFSSAVKWLLGTAFFVFSAFMTVQGITASVYDGVSVRAAKFAISKYVPVIGGYLSDGLNLVMSGSVLVKNALGISGILLLLVTVAPLIVQILILSLSLRFAGAVIEPIGDGRMSALVSDLGKNLTLLIAIVLAMVFLYFIFVLLIICTGNLAL